MTECLYVIYDKDENIWWMGYTHDAMTLAFDNAPDGAWWDKCLNKPR